MGDSKHQDITWYWHIPGRTNPISLSQTGTTVTVILMHDDAQRSTGKLSKVKPLLGEPVIIIYRDS